jgi:hypothetical protein
MTNNLPLRIALLAVALPAALAGAFVLAQQPSAEPNREPTTVPGIVSLPETGAAGEVQPVPRPDPNTLFEQANEVLTRRRSITCKLRHQAVLFGRSFVGSGNYAQGPASSRWMRYELLMKVGEREVYQLQVNDGRYLWQQRQYKDTPSLQRIDVDKVLAAMGQGGAPGAMNTEAATVLGLGGIGRLLTVLRKDFNFNVVFSSKLKANPNDIPVYGIEGRWRPEVLSNINLDSPQKLRPHVPDRVVVYLGCDDFFPYRFEFHREATTSDPNAAGKSQPLLVLDLFDVQFDAPLDEAMFRFNAGSQPFLDVTGEAATAGATTP